MVDSVELTLEVHVRVRGRGVGASDRHQGAAL